MIEIIRGAIGSGKTAYILKSIENRLKTSERKNIIVVPEQFSYTAERLVVGRFGGAGLNNVEVMTLSRLISRYLELRKENYLTAAGKMMITYKAINKLDETSLFYGCIKKAGFTEAAQKLISEFEEYMITPEVLREKAENTSNTLLRQKLYGIADILEEYLTLTKGRFYDSEEDILTLAKHIEDSRCFEGYDFWFDEFSVLLPQHYRIIQALLTNGCEVHISVCADSGERELYDVNRKIIRKLERLAQKSGETVKEYKTDDICRSITSNEMQFLLDNIDEVNNPNFKPWDEKTKDISVFISKDLYKEVYHTAIEIRKLIMEQDYRYRDIAVVCGNIEAYSHIIEAVFNDFDIPYFSDVRVKASEHPVSFLILSVFDIIVENWSYASVFRYLRTGYVYVKNDSGIENIDPEGIDLLENYVLKYGIKGKSIWLEDEKWKSAQRGIFEGILDENKSLTFSDEELEKINQTRKAFINPFLTMYENVSGKRSVREFAEALMKFLGDIYLYEGLLQKTVQFDEMGLRNESEQLRIIWNIVIETINQAVVVMGEEKCKREDFLGFMRSGLSAADILIIPPGVDRISVSSVDRSRQQEAKVMFIIGAVFGAIPKETEAKGILTDDARIFLREELEKDSLEIAAESRGRNELDRFNFFTVIFGVKDKIYITYPASDAEGNVQRPASVIGEFYRIFPKMATDDDIIEVKEEDYLYSPRAAYHYMLANYKKEGITEDIYKWYEKNAPQKLEIIKRAGEYKKNDAEITAYNAQKLYGNNKTYSITRLNEYGECPFGYFVKYGLKAKPRQIRQIQKFDLGSIMHMAVQMYCEEVEKDCSNFYELRKKWKTLSDDDSSTIVAYVMNSIKERIMNGVTRDENKINYIIMRMTKTVANSVDIIRKSLSAGEYSAVCYEKKFKVEIKWNNKAVLVNGVIDRIDMAEDAENKYAELRVVDYKTGSKDFSVVSICNKRDIQLVMYAIAAVEMYKSGDIKYSKSDYEPHMRAIVYNKMNDKKIEARDEVEGAEKQIKESLPDGLIILDPVEEEKNLYELEAALRIDEKFRDKQNSEVMKLILNNDESIKKGSQVASTHAFENLMDYVRKSVIEIDKEIFDGIIKIYPVCDKNGKACNWCDFEEICLYNERFDEKNNAVTKEEDAWEIIKREVEDNERQNLDS